MSTHEKQLPQTVTVGGKHYDLAALTEAARAQLPGLQFVEAQLELLNNRKVVVNTARKVYVDMLAESLPDKKAAANRKKDVITFGGERYWLEDFSGDARARLLNVQFTDLELERLHNEQVIARTARKHHVAILLHELKGVEPLKMQ